MNRYANIINNLITSEYCGTVLLNHYNSLKNTRFSSPQAKSLYRQAQVIVSFSWREIGKFVTDIAKAIGASILDLLKIFKNPLIIKFFSKIKWSFKNIFALLKTGYNAYKTLLKTVSEYAASTRVVKWTREELSKLDKFLSTHPKTKRIAGIAVAGLLVYFWFNMTFTGDAEYDFDMSDILGALSGNFALSDLFASQEGIKLLMLFALGAATGASFPWPGPASIHFITSIITTIGRKLGIRMKKTKIPVENQLQDLKLETT